MSWADDTPDYDDARDTPAAGLVAALLVGGALAALVCLLASVSGVWAH